ncbi:acyl-CoA dehydratase activase-related protein [Thermoanaerobacterium sp. DL9XJH110]|uniref:acyl-CoA dehydratase activase-related protein n=1 Tax=Thermoanaerobacterium sp. DL9XJH110 TaxID=3386643 RepID=UPI003BB6A4FC
MKIGIPRALLFYNYYPLWKTFFENLGHEVVLSGPTNKKILKDGVELTVDDACLPVKLFHGHVKELLGKVDALYVPRIVSVEPKKYICPKFLGLPDMIKSNIPDLPLMIDTKLDLYKRKSGMYEHFFQIGRILNKNKLNIIAAYIKAWKAYKNHAKRFSVDAQEALNNILNNYDLKNGINRVNDFKYAVLLLGHPYNLYDSFINMNLISKLSQNSVKVITPEMVPLRKILRGAANLPKDMFWTLGRNIIGCAYCHLEEEEIDGIIHVASFGCGPDSLVGELLERMVIRKYKMPFLYLNLDEHAGEAGFNTRLEAFLDILEGRKDGENNLSAYG